MFVYLYIEIFDILYTNKLDLSVYWKFLHPGLMLVVNVNIHGTFPFFWVHSQDVLSPPLKLGETLRLASVNQMLWLRKPILVQSLCHLGPWVIQRAGPLCWLSLNIQGKQRINTCFVKHPGVGGCLLLQPKLSTVVFYVSGQVTVHLVPLHEVLSSKSQTSSFWGDRGTRVSPLTVVLHLSLFMGSNSLSPCQETVLTGDFISSFAFCFGVKLQVGIHHQKIHPLFLPPSLTPRFCIWMAVLIRRQQSN